jgi:hypothetical protein
VAVAHDTGPLIRPGWSRVVVGGALLIAGIVWMLARLEVVDLSARLVLPLTLMGLGIVTMVAAIDGHHPGLVALGIVVSVVAVLGAMLPFDGVTGGIGERQYSISTVADLSEPYRLAIGQMRIDLGDLDVTQPATLEADVGLGSLIVIVPEGISVEIVADSQVGEVKLFGAAASGVGVEKMETYGMEPVLKLDLSTVIGSVEVRR